MISFITAKKGKMKEKKISFYKEVKSQGIVQSTI